MEALRNLGLQLWAIVKSWDPARRWAAGAGAALLLVLLGVTVYLGQRVDYRLLYGRMDPSEAAKAVAALEEQRVPYRLGTDGTSIYVPEDRVHRARLSLASKGLPKSDGTGFEIFDKPTFGLSDFVQRANYLRALQGELARTLSQIEGVASARVMIVMPESRLVVDAQRKATASVFLSLRYPGALGPQAVSAVRFMVSNAVEGLRPSNVTVVDNAGNVLTDGPEDSATAVGGGPQLAVRKEVERYLTEKLRSMLDTVLGQGQSVVRVSVDINTDSVTRSDEFYNPAHSAPRNVTRQEELTDNLSQVPGGVAGVGPNTPTNVLSSTNAVVGTRQQRRESTEEFAVGRSVSNVVQQAGGLRHVSAAVFVNLRQVSDGGQRRLVPRDPADLEKLRRAVAVALGSYLVADAKAGDVVVEEIPFGESPQEQSEAERRQAATFALLERLAVPVGAVVAALVVVVFLSRRLRGRPPEEFPLGGVPVGAVLSQPSEAGSRPVTADFNLDPDRPEHVTIEVLRGLVEQSPDKMTEAARALLAARDKK